MRAIYKKEAETESIKSILERRELCFRALPLPGLLQVVRDNRGFVIWRWPTDRGECKEKVNWAKMHQLSCPKLWGPS